MGILNEHWYVWNASTPYPLDDAATCVDDSGARLPFDVLVDLNLRWPVELGRYAFVGSIAVTPRLLTVTFLAADAPTSAGSFRPLAVVSARQPVSKGRVIAVSPQAEGVAGWAVFGSGANERVGLSARFSSPAQTLLLRRGGSSYRGLPVTGLRTAAAGAPLTGLIKLRAEKPLEIAVEERDINNVLRTCLVVRLIDDSDSTNANVSADAAALLGLATTNVFQRFSGPCAARPESGTCGDPEPVQFINAVAPDCNGVLTLDFRGCAFTGSLVGGGGIVLDCGLGLADACLAKALPTSDGLLPSEHTPVVITPPPDVPPEGESSGISEAIVPNACLPYTECFDDGDADDFVVREGLWTFLGDKDIDPIQLCATTPTSPTIYTSDSASIGSPEQILYSSNTTGSRNLAVWEGCDDIANYRRVITDFKVMAGPDFTPGGADSGALYVASHNAGVVMNYHEDTTVPGRFDYFLALVDHDQQQVGFYRYNGIALQPVIVANTPGLLLNNWYRMTVSIKDGPSRGQTALTVQVQSINDFAMDVTVGPVLVRNYMPSVGRFGLYADRSITRFSCFRVTYWDG